MQSNLQDIGQSLRGLRIAKSMTQEALAVAAGISRTTLVQIEKGKDAQFSKVEAIAHVMGAQIGVLVEPAQMVLRRQARADLQAKQAASREKHLKIALIFALGSAEAEVLKERALRMVALWKERELCSPVYIDRWQGILSGSLQDVAQGILRMDGEWGPALRQNTPFATDMA
jgi:DNA-binding XRE family transcriptional regulator